MPSENRFDGEKERKIDVNQLNLVRILVHCSLMQWIVMVFGWQMNGYSSVATVFWCSCYRNWTLFLIFTGFVHISIGAVRLKISNPFADELFFESIVSMIWMNWYWLNQIKITLSVHLFLSSQKCSVHCSHSGKLVNEFTFVYIFDESHKTIETPSKSYFTLLSFDCFEMVEPRWERMEQNNQLCVISPQTAFTNCWHSNFPTMRVSRIFYQRFSGMF